MLTYTIRRLVLSIPMLLFISIVIFLLLQLAPGDPMAQVPLTVPPEVKELMREALGLGEPIHVQYWKWLERHGANLPEKPPADDEPTAADDSGPGKICPECGHFLTRCRVGHGVDFHVDRCATCGGLWFDRNEWEILKARNLHDDVHFIFSAAWQHRLAEDEQRETYEHRVATLLGEADYGRVRDFKRWVAEHEKRSTVMAYLGDLDI